MFLEIDEIKLNLLLANPKLKPELANVVDRVSLSFVSSNNFCNMPTGNKKFFFNLS